MKLAFAILFSLCLLTPIAAQESPLLRAEITDTPFQQYLTYRKYRVETQDHRSITGGFVHGPGHHAAAIAAFVLDDVGMPYAVFKRGDTRLSRAERRESYVKVGWIAGRLDKAGASGAKIALDELAEEVGGSVVPASFHPLGSTLSPTMPFESSECDSYFAAVVQLTGQPYGDGGSMEAVGLIGPLLRSAQAALLTLDGEEICDAGRARTMFARGLDSIGFIPQLGVYVHDHPQLKARFDSCGLGAPSDPRQQVRGVAISPQLLVQPQPTTSESRINDVVCTSRSEIALDPDISMVAAQTRHAVRTDRLTPILKEFPNQYLHTNYDRAKVAVYFVDPVRGPVVQLTPQLFPAQAFAPSSAANPPIRRLDISDVKVSRGQNPVVELREHFAGRLRTLSAKTGASGGQSDLYYHFLACETEPAEGFMPLSQAIRECRTGQGDAQTEATLLRLADSLQWIPSLNLSLEEARTQLTLDGAAPRQKP